jgi:hypothetical protein
MPLRGPFGRRATTAILAALLWTGLASADEVAVPATMQAKLTAKLASFDRAFGPRAGVTAHVLLVVRAGDAASTRFAQELMGAFEQTATVGGVPHEESLVTYAGAASLAAIVKSQRPAIVYLSAGLAGEARAIGEALAGLDVLTVSAEPAAVQNGVAVGYDLISNEPKIIVNLKQAKSQNVQLAGTVLKLAIITGA